MTELEKISMFLLGLGLAASSVGIFILGIIRAIKLWF